MKGWVDETPKTVCEMRVARGRGRLLGWELWNSLVLGGWNAKGKRDELLPAVRETFGTKRGSEC